MTLIEILTGIVAALAMIGAYFIEWRRGNNAERLIAVEARLVSLESRPDYGNRLASVEQSIERLRRNL